jgi:FAD/FMN-containing dehydrogenase/fatty acid desaturase
VNASLSLLTAHPLQQFRRSRRFYLAYDSFYAALGAGLIVLKVALGLPALAGKPTMSWLIAFPIALYAVVLAHLSIHNAVHGNFPRRINRAVGELLGVIVVVRFASWVMVHLRHHRFSDDRQLDPHPNFPSYWKTVKHTVVYVEKQLMCEYFDLWGDSKETRASEARRAKVSYAANVLLLLAWMSYLGPWLFGLVFLPANVFGALFIMHFNWVTHNGPHGKDFRPVNLNTGYFWFGNKIFAGIYMHANHHERPHLFNPAKWNAEKFGSQPACFDTPKEAAREARMLRSYSGLHLTRPREIHEPRDLDSLATLLRRAEAQGRKVTVRGAGRSFDDQAMNDDVVVDVTGMDRVISFDVVGRRMTVEPAVSARAMLDLTLPHGLVPHILVTTPWATAGGALSANCISRSTPRYGSTGDHVQSFQLLTVGGETLVCSRETNADVFHAAIGGFGYFGVVTQITYDLLEVGDRVRMRTEIDRRESLPAFVEHLTDASLHPEPHDAVCSVFSLAHPQRGAVLRSSYTDEPIAKTLFLHRPWAWYRPFAEILFSSSTVANAVCHASYKHVFGGGPFVDDLRGYTFCMEGNERMRSMSSRLGARIRSLQPSYAVPADGLLHFLREAADLFAKFRVYPSLLDALFRPADGFLLSAAQGLPSFCISFTFEAITRNKYARLEPCILALNDACAAAGGRIHLVKDVRATRTQMRAMYGHAEVDFNRVKSRVDPRGILVNGFFARTFG